MLGLEMMLKSLGIDMTQVTAAAHNLQAGVAAMQAMDRKLDAICAALKLDPASYAISSAEPSASDVTPALPSPKRVKRAQPRAAP